tara:strand:+ start:1000 stop:2418 length:1419 start_codon:yes stop_codon:yes gene_type:complete
MKKLFKILILSLFTFSFGQQIEWIQSYGGNGNEYGQSGQKTSDGGYIVLGQTSSDSEEYNDILLIKFDIDGNQEWSKTFSFGSDEYGYSVRQTLDDGYILTGGVWNQGTFVLKTDSNGNEEWSQIFYEDEYGEDGRSIQQTLDGGYILTGNSGSFSNPYIFLLKINSEGQEEWVNYFGGDDNELGVFIFDISIQQTLDGGYILLTTKDTTGGLGSGGYDVFLLKLDSEGNEQWNKTFGVDGQNEIGRSIQKTTDNGYVFTGQDSNGRVLLVKTDQDGNELWSHSDYTDYSIGNYVHQTEDEGYILSGTKNSFDLLVIKTDLNGNEEWIITHDIGTNGVIEGNVVQPLTDGDYIVIGTEWVLFGDRDVVLVKINSDENLDNTPIQPSVYSFKKPYPNPFNPSTMISFSIPSFDRVSINVYDLGGSLVTTLVDDYYHPGNHTINWDGSNYSSGNYIVMMKSNNYESSQIITLVK